MKGAVLVILLFHYSSSILGDLSVGPKQCGKKNCDSWEYCSDIDKFCRKCSDICEETSHNFDSHKCITDCQDYLHDIRYERKSKTSKSGDENLHDVVQKLHYLVTVTLSLVCITLIILFSLISCQVWKWKKNNNLTFKDIRNKILMKKSDDSNKIEQTSVNLKRTPGKPDLRLDMPSHPTQSEHSPATLSTTISRRPAEDSTLDYAYDNPAMASPSPK